MIEKGVMGIISLPQSIIIVKRIVIGLPRSAPQTQRYHKANGYKAPKMHKPSSQFFLGIRKKQNKVSQNWTTVSNGYMREMGPNHGFFRCYGRGKPFSSVFEAVQNIDDAIFYEFSLRPEHEQRQVGWIFWLITRNPRVKTVPVAAGIK